MVVSQASPIESRSPRVPALAGPRDGNSLLGITPEIWRAIRGVHEPLLQGRRTLKVGFSGVHCLPGQFDARLRDAHHQFDDRVCPFPGHRAGILGHSIYRVEQGTIPVLCESSLKEGQIVVMDMLRSKELRLYACCG